MARGERRASPAACGSGVLPFVSVIFLSHGMAFAMYGIMTAALCILGAASFRADSWTIQTRAVCCILVAVVIVRLIAVTASWQHYRSDYREFTALAEKIPRGSLTMGVMVGAGHHETDVPRCQMYAPLLIAQHDQIGPLFAFQGQHPLLLAGP
jgi:hypothetical protein